MNIKVLIVEDEYIVANDVRIVLEGAGYKVNGIASSAEEADDFIRLHKPDLVLLDIQLKGKLSGIDLARKLKSDNIAFVYLSANSSQKILEEAKSTEPYGFLVKPFRPADLLVTLDVALYRHTHSLESKLRQEQLLQKKLSDISDEISEGQQKLLMMARVIQSYIPFDVIASGCRPLNPGNFDDTAYVRIGFDEYQFIGEQELLTIAGLTKHDLTQIIKNTTDVSAGIYSNDEQEKGIAGTSLLQKLLFDSFNLGSYLVFPVILSNGSQVHYFFYSRKFDIYTKDHIDLLNRLTFPLTAIAEKMVRHETALVRTIDHSVQHPSEKQKGANHLRFKGIVGTHPLLLAALDLTAQVAAYNTSVLILGESGSGKEKVAQYIHALSPRKKGPLIKVNCAAIPPTLMESELFGHEKGAFTGALEKRKGKFEQADGGTIFLDEIGELPLGMQAKLLRVLQEKEIEHVGGHSPIKLNVRIVAATNRNLEKEVAEGNFRLDLYYRLNVFPIIVPALRERKTDIEALSLFFANKFCTEFNKPFNGIAVSMMEEMLAYHWPGNIRELENVLEQSVILNDGISALTLKRSLSVTATELAGSRNINTLEDVKHIQRETERTYIISILKKTNGRIRGANGAAEMLNIIATTLESKMAKLNIRKEDFMNSL
jgi:DNA-binding NtrC family response regulator